MSRAFALKGAGTLPGKATPPLEVQELRAEKMGFGSGSALWYGPFSPDDKDFGPGHTYPTPQTLYGVTLRLPQETPPPCSPVERCTPHSWTSGQRQRQPQSTALSSCSPLRAHGCSEEPASPGKRVAPFMAGFLAIFYKTFRPIFNL